MNITNSIKKIRDMIRIKFSDHYSIIPILREQGAEIGNNCRIYIKHIGEPYLVRIGNHVTISADALLLTHDGAVWVGRNEQPFLNKMGTIAIKDNCFIGAKSIILPNTVIGPNSVVGAGSVVTKEVLPNTVVAGNPARSICTVDEYLEKTSKGSIHVPDHIKKNMNEGKDMDRFDQIMKDVIVKHFWGSK